jgi:eukaryotic-like serine/threonine-protein kinase
VSQAFSKDQLVANQFRVVDLVRETDLIETYEARDTTGGQTFALEVLKAGSGADPTRWQNVLEQARDASKLAGDICAALHESGADPDHEGRWLLREFVRSAPLGAQVASGGPWPVKRVSELLSLLAPGFDKLHRADLSHRALGPDNVYLVDGPAGAFARVTDFGHAELRDAPLTPPGWSPPDQTARGPRAAPTTDTYSLGHLAFLALTGKPFFLGMQAGKSDARAVQSEQRGTLPSASDRATELGASLPSELDAFFIRALAVNPSRRFKSVREMAEVFADAVPGGVRPPPEAAAAAIPSGRASMPPPPPPPPSSLAARGVPPPPPSKRMSVPPPPPSKLRAAAAAAAGPLAPPPPPPPGTTSAVPASSPPGTADSAPPPADAAPASSDPVPAPAAPETAAASEPPAAESPTPAEPAAGPQAAAPAPVPVAATVAEVDLPDDPAKRKSRRRVVLIGGGVVAVILVIALVASAGGGGHPTEAAVSAPAAATTPAKSATAAPAPKPSQSEAPPEAPAPKRETALVKLTCAPDCDKVTCDEKAVDNPGQGIELAPGEHQCVATKKGYVPLKRTVTTVAGEDQEVTLELRRAGGGTAAPRKPAVKPKPKPTSKPCNPFKPCF